MLSISLLSALSAPPSSDPEPDNLYGTIVRASYDITATSYVQRSYEPPPTLPPVPPNPLRQACRVCGAAAGAPCDPERLGKAGRRGATAHRSR